MTTAIFKLVDAEVISVRGLFRDSEVNALTYRGLAVHKCVDDPSRYVITIKSIGLCLPPDWCWFDSIRNAVEAMVEIAMLRNEWDVRQVDLTPALGERMRAICSRRGATCGPSALAAEVGKTVLGRPIREAVQ